MIAALPAEPEAAKLATAELDVRALALGKLCALDDTLLQPTKSMAVSAAITEALPGYPLVAVALPTPVFVASHHPVAVDVDTTEHQPM